MRIMLQNHTGQLGCTHNNSSNQLRNELRVPHCVVGVFIEEGGDESHGVEGGVSQGLVRGSMRET